MPATKMQSLPRPAFHCNGTPKAGGLQIPFHLSSSIKNIFNNMRNNKKYYFFVSKLNVIMSNFCIISEDNLKLCS
jgi:hypothetical protein